MQAEGLPVIPPVTLSLVPTRELIEELIRRHKGHIIVLEPFDDRSADSHWVEGKIAWIVGHCQLVASEAAQSRARPPMPGPGDHPTDLREGDGQ